MTSSGREPKIYLRGVTPRTHIWWPWPPPLPCEELLLFGVLFGFYCLSDVPYGKHTQMMVLFALFAFFYKIECEVPSFSNLCLNLSHLI